MIVCAAASLFGAVACGSEDTAKAFALVTEIESPASEGSSEPFLFADDGAIWMTWNQRHGDGHRVMAARYDGSSWGPPKVVTEGDSFFVNWADFPSVFAVGDTLAVHWLQRGDAGGYDYGVRVAWSVDGGDRWSAPWSLHDDASPTEHGFVSMFQAGDGLLGAVWLDGRQMVDGGPMTIRGRTFGPDGEPGPEQVIDARTCECCQTDATVANGVPVIAYRDRGEANVRNIHVARLEESGWTEGQPVHDDGWVIGGCPVNGPALSSVGDRVAIAWFTAPEDAPRVNVAFSEDGGRTFALPIRVDEGAPAGRVDLLSLDDGSALVVWLERRAEGATILARRVWDSGVSQVSELAATSQERASGFPRMARLDDGRILVGWTDPSGSGQVRLTLAELGS